MHVLFCTAAALHLYFVSCQKEKEIIAKNMTVTTGHPNNENLGHSEIRPEEN